MFNSYHKHNISTVVKNTTNVEVNIPPPPKVSLVKASSSFGTYYITFNPKHPVLEHYPLASKLQWKLVGSIYVSFFDIVETPYDRRILRSCVSGKGILVTKELSSPLFDWEHSNNQFGRRTCGTYERMYDDLFFRQQDLDNSRLTYKPT